MRRPVVVVAALVAVIILVLGVAQLVLPGLAARRVRDQLAPYGTVQSVHVHAFPAVELLWHHADRVDVALSSYDSSSGQAGSLLGQAGDVGTLNVTVDTVQVGLLRLRDAVLSKRGRQLLAEARVTEADLRAAVPFLSGVSPVASSGGQLVLQGTASLLGVSVSAEASVAV